MGIKFNVSAASFMALGSVPDKAATIPDVDITEALPFYMKQGVAGVQSVAQTERVVQSVTVHTPQAALTPQEEAVAELLALESKLVKYEVTELLKRKEELRKYLVAEISTEEAGKPVSFACPAGVIEFGVPSKEFKLGDKTMLETALGTETYNSLAKFSITDLKKVMSENELATVGSYVSGTSRTMKIKIAQ